MILKALALLVGIALTATGFIAAARWLMRRDDDEESWWRENGHG